MPINHNRESRFKRLSSKLKEKGIITVGAKIPSWLKGNWNINEFILVPEHPLSKLLIEQVQRVDHGGVESTLARLQSKYWIPRARKMIKAIKGKYTVCRNQDKCIGIKFLGQLPAECMAPLYFYTSLDLFGLFQVRDTVEHRVRRKVYGVVFARLSSRPVHLELAKGYDTESSVKRIVNIILSSL
ncbi:uncharacterized protein [Penaeus vannamei]|uniref:uncharacterized protein n=1 Tax=Penaeus vannamei TaxID=6689 RepID=UPI00387F9834